MSNRPRPLFVANDNILTLDGLTNTATASYINDATVQVTVKDSNGTPVTGESWPLAMGYVSASNGKYRAVLQDTLSVTVGANYTAEITVDGDSLDAFWTLPLRGSLRGFVDALQ